MSEAAQEADDEPAIGGIGPESPAGDDGGDGDEDEGAIGMGPSGTVVSRGRKISDKERELFKAAAKSVREQLRDAEGDGDFGAYDEGVTRSARAGDTAGAAATAAAPAVNAQTTTPQPNPTHEREAARLDQYAAQLTEREKTLAARELAVDMDRHRDAYFERGAPALVDLVKQWTGITDEHDLRDEVADLITELSTHVLGAAPDPNLRAKIEAKRATKGVKAQMAKLTQREQAMAAERQAIADKEQRTQTERLLHEEINKPEIVKQFPFLALENEAGGMVYDAVAAQFQRDGTMLPWMEAAKRINDYLSKKWNAEYDRRSHLFASRPPPPGTGSQRAQGDPQGIRRSHSLTNAAAASTGTMPAEGTTKPYMRNGRFNAEAGRDATKQRLRSAFGPKPGE